MNAPQHTAQGEEIMGWAQVWTENRTATWTLCYSCGVAVWKRQDWDMMLTPITARSFERFMYGSCCYSCGVDIIQIISDMAEATQAEHAEEALRLCESGACRCAWDAH